ncbi:MAG: hypothetical protein WC211_03735 [Dehalococcoidia bacterium]
MAKKKEHIDGCDGVGACEGMIGTREVWTIAWGEPFVTHARLCVAHYNATQDALTERQLGAIDEARRKRRKAESGLSVVKGDAEA